MALLLEFPSVVNAVHCAIEVQTAMAGRTAAMAEDQRIAFRVGINLGDIVEGDDIFGHGVNAPSPNETSRRSPTSSCTRAGWAVCGWTHTIPTKSGQVSIRRVPVIARA